MTIKIVPIYKRLQYNGPDKKDEVITEREALMYDVYVDGTWRGSRRLAMDAELLALSLNTPVSDYRDMVE